MLNGGANGHITNATATLTLFGKAMLMQGSHSKLSSFNATHILAKEAHLHWGTFRRAGKSIECGVALLLNVMCHVRQQSNHESF